MTPETVSLHVAIDPGRHTGVSAFQRGPSGWGLVRCGLLRSEARNVNGLVTDLCRDLGAFLGTVPGYTPGNTLATCELMVFRPDDSRSVAEDLIQVSTLGATLAGRVSAHPPRFVPALDWKGSVPKPIMDTRIRACLNEWETRVAESSGVPLRLLHNVIDSIGIGLHATGRMRRGGSL